MKNLALLCTLATASLAQPRSSPMTARAEDVARVASLRVLFGHQSVGGNLLLGVEEVSGGKVPIQELGSATRAERGVVHFFAGRNEAPDTKLEAFEQAVDRLQGQVDVAMLKLCYIDFSKDTDATALFTRYRDLLTRLHAKYPQVRFVAVTAPLTVVQGGAKGWLKHTFAGGAWGEQENVKRHAFNQLLRAAYPADQLFDLAALESTRDDGSPELDAARVPRLRADFTKDGGHLDAKGRQAVAVRWLEFLAKEPVSSPPAR